MIRRALLVLLVVIIIRRAGLLGVSVPAVTIVHGSDEINRKLEAERAPGCPNKCSTRSGICHGMSRRVTR